MRYSTQAPKSSLPNPDQLEKDVEWSEETHTTIDDLKPDKTPHPFPEVFSKPIDWKSANSKSEASLSSGSSAVAERSRDRQHIVNMKKKRQSSKSSSEGCTESNAEVEVGQLEAPSFIRLITPEMDAVPLRRTLAFLLYHNVTEGVIALLTTYNLVMICMDTDARADPPGSKSSTSPPAWVTVSQDILYCIFAVEFLIRVYLEGSKIFYSSFNCIDIAVVSSGLFEYILRWSNASELSGIGMFRMLRLLRLLRLMRVLKLFSMLKELKKLVQMMGACFKTLFWSTLLLIVVIVMWACIAVETINPLIQSLVEEGFFSDCPRCQRSFSTVFDASLTLFQTIVAGDSWGAIAVPVIEVYPEAAVIFCGALMMLIFGVLNLIVAVVVDSFAEGRSKNIVALAQELDAEEIEERKNLQKIFDKIDDDQSGCVTYDELKEGARKVSEFRHWLRVLDIDGGDLQQLFHMVDEDGSGEIDPAEFIDAMYRMKNAESKTGVRFVKHLVGSIHNDQKDIVVKLDDMGESISSVESALKHTLTDQDPRLFQIIKDKSEELLQAKLQEQEQTLRQSIDALKRASEVTIEALSQAFVATAIPSSSTVQLVDGGLHQSRQESNLASRTPLDTIPLDTPSNRPMDIPSLPRPKIMNASLPRRDDDR